MREVVASALLEARLLRRSPAELFPLYLVPLTTLTYLAIFRFAGRDDLELYAVIAPGIIAMWSLALLVSGEVIANARDDQTLEPLAASPAGMSRVLIGRIATVTVLSMVGFPVAALTAWLAFGIDVVPGDPLVFVVAWVATGLATAATAVVFSVVFVNSRSPRIFQNAMGYPFYLLGGVIVPIALYPDWVQPIARLVYLSWSADLLRESATGAVDADWPLRVMVVLALGAAGYLVSAALLRATLRRAREAGTLGLA